MAQNEAVEFRKCRASGCGCTVLGDETYCSRHCEEHVTSAMRSGQGCECGHADCRNDKPPAV